MAAEGLHPTLDRLYTVRDALVLGFGHILSESGLRRGEVIVTYQDPTAKEPVESLQIVDFRAGVLTMLSFPDYQQPDAMSVDVIDDDTFLAGSVPLLARLILADCVGAGLEIQLDEELTGSETSILRTKQLMFSLTSDAVIVSFDERLGIDPLMSEYDSEGYRWAGKRLCTPVVDELVGAASDFL